MKLNRLPADSSELDYCRVRVRQLAQAILSRVQRRRGKSFEETRERIRDEESKVTSLLNPGTTQKKAQPRKVVSQNEMWLRGINQCIFKCIVEWYTVNVSFVQPSSFDIAVPVQFYETNGSKSPKTFAEDCTLPSVPASS